MQNQKSALLTESNFTVISAKGIGIKRQSASIDTQLSPISGKLFNCLTDNSYHPGKTNSIV